jgi:hypothetical protein
VVCEFVARDLSPRSRGLNHRLGPNLNSFCRRAFWSLSIQKADSLYSLSVFRILTH